MSTIFAGHAPCGLTPVKQDSKGLAWAVEDVVAACAADINVGTYFQRRVKTMTQDFAKATEVCDDATKLFKRSMDSMLEAEARISEVSKRTSGNVRKAADDLQSGLSKIEKVASFDRLDRAVTVLERAAAALTILAELEKDGKLERIANAVKA
jgi:hypothetical protein